MAEIDSIVNVTISKQTKALTVAGFGRLLILTNEVPLTAFTERSRLYEDTASITADFGSTTQIFKAVNAVFSQSPRPTDVRVGRMNVAVAAEKNMLFDGPVILGNVIDGTVNGIAINQVFDTTNDITLTALAVKIAAAQGIASAVFNTPDDIDITADEQWSLDVLNFVITGGATQAGITVSTTVAGNTIADDLTLVINEVDDFYFVGKVDLSASTPPFSPEEDIGAILTLATSVAGLIKLSIMQSAEPGIKAATTTDVAAQLDAANNERAAILYRDITSDYGDAAWVGRVSPIDPGGIVFNAKELSNVTVTPTSDVGPTERTNILNKSANLYTEVGGVGFAQAGTSSSGQFLDIVRDVDYMQSQIQLEIFRQIVVLNKIPFTQGGIDLILGTLRGTLNRMVTEGILTDSPDQPIVITAKTVVDVPVNDRANRLLSDVEFSAYLSGAIQTVQVVGIVQV